MKQPNPTRKELRKFSFLFFAVCLIAGGISYYKGSTLWWWLAGGAALFLLAGVFTPAVLRPFYFLWMKFATALGWINTRLLLGIIYLLIFTPAGIFVRLLRRDPLKLRFDRSAATYWVKREGGSAEKERYKHMF